ncbi:hypothetical protein BBP40_006638 [Aspergillus hancockii]|nr:hypothetical protein BBP40_006638 [Aspergillus hancockii]
MRSADFKEYAGAHHSNAATESSSDAAQTSAVGKPKLPIPRLGTAAPIRAHRQRTSRACAPCHQRKTKCGGEKLQCKQCHDLDIPCSYPGSKRDREKWALQSAQAKVQSYESLLEKIFTASKGDPLKAKILEDLLHKHVKASPAVLASLLALASPLNRSPSPLKYGLSLNRMHAAWTAHERSELQPLDTEPLVQITAIDHWTSLVDNDTASHLLSFYFAWENPTWQLIDQYSFIDDLEHRRGKFCSSLLVTALLFFGCSLSYNLDKITDRREEKYLSKKLYAEIQRLWELEKNDASLPTAQSSILIGLLCCTFGLDRIGTQYIMHGAQLCLRLGLHHEHPSYLYGDSSDEALLPSQYYYATIASLCQIFCANASSAEDDIPDLEIFNPYTTMSKALDDMGTLIVLFKRCHGWKSLAVVMLHYFCVAGVHSVSKLDAEDPKWGFVLEDCVVGLWHMSLGWGRLCTAFLRTIELVLKQTKPDPALVPFRAVEIFKHMNEGELWTTTDISSLAADYVVHHVPTQGEPEAGAWPRFRSQGLQNLITSMDDLSIASSSKAPRA